MTNGVAFAYSNLDAQWEHDAMRFWRNDGGTFTEVSSAVGVTDTGSGKGLLTFDYDSDGDLDRFVGNNAGQRVLYRNDGGNESDWLDVRTLGTSLNRDGLGAMITVNSGIGEKILDVNAGRNFLGQNEFTAHFGLGQGHALIGLVTIEWPSGAMQQFHNVAPDTLLVVAEPIPEPTTALMLIMLGWIFHGQMRRGNRG